MISNHPSNRFVALVIAFVVALASWAIVDKSLQKTAARIVLTGYFPADTKVTAYSVDDNNQKRHFGEFRISGDASRKLQYEGTGRANIPVSRIELDFALEANSPSTAQTFSLVSIEVRMPFAQDIYFSANRIASNFSSQQGTSEVYADYQFNEGVASLISNQAIGKDNWVLGIAIAALFFMLTWFVVESSAWTQIPAFSDMSLGKRISSRGEFNTINGVRGLAAILVLFSHTSPGFEALKIGLAILFVISGFLLAKPFVIDNSKIFSLSNIKTYLTKRIKRILPMYYLYIFLVYVLAFEFETAIRHFLFLQAEGHLWPMTQIFGFYMLLPLALIVCSSAAKLHRVLPLILLSAAIYYSVTLMVEVRPFYNGKFNHPFYLYAFLIGLLGSYIQYGFLANSTMLRDLPRIAKEVIGGIGLIVATLTIVWSGPIKPDPAITAYLSQFYIKCILCVTIILLALNSSGSVFDRIIANRVFRSVGVIGFSFYLLHGLGMQIADNFALQFLGNEVLGGRSWEFTLGAFVVTYVMAVLAYSYVERPFFGYKQTARH